MVVRRSNVAEPRIELIPLIDVLMFLLAFFLVAMTVTVRVELLPMDLRPLRAADPATPRPATSISIALDGTIAIDREQVALDDMVPKLKSALEMEPTTVIYLAIADGQGAVDRAPLLQEVFDRLKDAGLSVALVGKPNTGQSTGNAPRTP